MKDRYGVIRAPMVASLALALAAPLGVVWAQPSGDHGDHGDHQHDSRSNNAGQHGASPQSGAHAPRGAGTPTPQHAHDGAPGAAAGHFSAAPRFHAPPVRPGSAGAPAQNFRPAPQAAPAPAARGPAFHGHQGGPNPAPDFGRNGAANSSGHFANNGRDAGQGERGIAPNHDRNGGFDADREHDGRDGHDGRDEHDGRLVVRRPEERHYDRDHWQDHRHWDGGYWNGRYWPAIHDRADFVWLLPALPVGYVTYSWDGVPYYYYDDTYYTWDPSYNGYVATVPPPVDDSGPLPDEAQPEQPEQPEQADAPLYAYPIRGQSPEQQAQDRQDCQQWASSQSPSEDDDYQRALKACLTGRGYSVD